MLIELSSYGVYNAHCTVFIGVHNACCSVFTGVHSAY